VNIEKIAKHYQKLNDNQKRRFHINYFWLTQLCKSAISLRGPYKFVLDSSIVMRLEDVRKENYLEGILSVMMFFDFYKKQDLFDADLVLTPVVFYEFFRCRQVESLQSYWKNFTKVRNLIEDTLQTEVLNENLDSFEKTENFINLIEHDVKQIKKRLLEIRSETFNYNFVQHPEGVTGIIRDDGFLNVPPVMAAEQIYKEIETKYFHPGYVGLFLKDHIVYKLCNNPKNDLEFANQFENEFDLKNVMYLDNNNKVKGLADIELLTKCNVRHQFDLQRQGNYFPASIALTIDHNLGLALTNMSQMVISNELIGGEKKEDMKAKIDISHDDISRRMNKLDDIQISFAEVEQNYYREISKLFD